MSEPITPGQSRQIAGLQERAARASAPPSRNRPTGCWLRHSNSAATWWAGATLVHGPIPAGALDARIAAAEAFYAARRETPGFQICPACPPDLDEALARRGYVRQDLVSLQVRTQPSQPDQQTAAPTTAALRDKPDAEWFAIWLATAGPHTDADAEWQLLRRVHLPSAYVTVSIADRPVSVGRAVADTGWTGVFNMATLPEARGQGAARAVLATRLGSHPGSRPNVFAS